MILAHGLKTSKACMEQERQSLKKKKNLMEGLALYAKHNQDAPAWIKNKAYKVVYKFDAESILNYYRGIFTNAALERITGIKSAANSTLRIRDEASSSSTIEKN